MKLLILAQEMPFPPNHGGSADIWRRILALSELGHELFVVTWSYAARDDADFAEHSARLAEPCAKVKMFFVDRSIHGLLRRLPHLLTLPSFVAARRLPDSEFEDLLAAAISFGPDAVILDGLAAAWPAVKLASRLGRPLLYRAHNREYEYLVGQQKLATSLRGKLGLFLAKRGLREVEIDVLQRARYVLNISVDDLSAWRAEGFKNGVWLPPLMDPAAGAVRDAAPDIDFAYVGNLRTPNNVHGVRWFLAEVLPQIRQVKPDAAVVVAGSNPVPEIVQLAESLVGVTLLANVPDRDAVLSRGRTLINPVFMSSGVNIKSVDMLSIGSPIVTTTAGIAGLPRSARALFEVADSAEDFAAACLASLSGAETSSREERRRVTEMNFGTAALRNVFDELDLSVTGSEHPSRSALASA